MAASWRTTLIRKSKKKANSCIQDVEQVLKYFHGLRPGMQEYTYENGRQAELFALEGTIPIKFRDVTYNIPVCVLLQEGHPEVVPLVYVRPTRSMVIKASPYVDRNGKVDHPYLHKWNYKSSNINTLLQELCKIFAQHPPVYAISRGPSSSTLQQSQRNSQQGTRPLGSMSQNPPAQGSITDESKKECIICMGEEPNSVLIPCGHLGLCITCAREVQRNSKRCPVCRADINQVHQVYES